VGRSAEGAGHPVARRTASHGQRCRDQFQFEVLVLNAVLYTVGALGIHQLIFEDMTYELRAINRRLEAAREELVHAAMTDPLTGFYHHKAGDRVLQDVAGFVKRHIREADCIFRWGGDEFLVLITCTTDDARRKAAVLKANFDAAPELVDLPPGIGLSVGWTEVPHGTTDVVPLVHQADQRMYENKGSRGVVGM
jgi:GGDEF domain-containing protein